MCGFNGIYAFNNTFCEPQKFDVLRDTLKFRGPDEGGTFSDEKVLLGHRRLAIIDLASGLQPMWDSTQKIIIAFNGEIYNFLDLREELITLGVSFSTNSDTEVILEAYKTWGIVECLKKLEGMFAFALWDTTRQELFVARDRYGEKPLYYTQSEQGLYFGSELKALKEFYDSEKISKRALNLYFSLTYIPAPYTIYEDVFKLEAGSYLKVSENKVKQHFYYNALTEFEEANKDQIQSYDEAKKELHQLLFDSIKQRMISEVPLGSFLSGGIDSSIVSAIMAKVSPTPIKTFSIGFKEKAYDESERAALVAKHIGSEHTLHVLDHHDLLTVVDDTIAYFDEPFGDSSAIPSMMVAKKAKEKVTVVLTGDCADELFGGYEKYLAGYYASKYSKVPSIVRKPFESIVNIVPHNNRTNQKLRQVKKVIKSAKLNESERYQSLCSLGFNNQEKDKLLLEDLNVDSDIQRYFNEKSGDELSKTFYSDLKLVLEGDMLTKVDRACMINSLEARVPFLDSKIVHFSARLPHQFKIQGTNKKKILKETFADLLPPETMAFSKKGFGLPLRLWFQTELKDELLNLLDPQKIDQQGFLNTNYIQKILKEHFNNEENHSSKLWLLFIFQKWLKNNQLEN
tara:strand:+ start:22242 stop:24122 length:1881 start_codon:yes stop_codon:yes gene_type:complete